MLRQIPLRRVALLNDLSFLQTGGRRVGPFDELPLDELHFDELVGSGHSHLDFNLSSAGAFFHRKRLRVTNLDLTANHGVVCFDLQNVFRKIHSKEPQPARVRSIMADSLIRASLCTCYRKKHIADYNDNYVNEALKHNNRFLFTLLFIWYKYAKYNTLFHIY